MHGTIPPLHNACSRRNAELRIEIYHSVLIRWEVVPKAGQLIGCPTGFVKRQGYVVQNSV
jgi:hypothetical protein